ncbi:SDR family NAD(P)-dependent oxidoreductase [Chloroflexota bacterium]
MKLEDKVAIVTGASAGIGKAISTAFSREGASVLCASLHEEKCKETALLIAKEGAKSSFFALDVSHKTEVEKMVSKCLADFGKVDILVNSAGGWVGGSKPFLEETEEEWDRTIDVNLKGTFLCSQTVAKEMIKAGNGGRIINISSVSCETVPYQAKLVHYVASKGGVTMLTKGMAVALIPHKIYVNAIAPGWTRSPQLIEWAEKYPHESAREQAGIPLGRFAEPEEIANMAVFLASSDSDYIVGQTIFVDGGYNIIHNVP